MSHVLLEPLHFHLLSVVILDVTWGERCIIVTGSGVVLIPTTTLLLNVGVSETWLLRLETSGHSLVNLRYGPLLREIVLQFAFSDGA